MSKEFDCISFREEFTAIENMEMIYLDSAATSLKPKLMSDTVDKYYKINGATVHRSLHKVGKETTEKFELARHYCAKLINSISTDNIVWTRGTTESINMIAYGFLSHNINEGDEIIINDSEHHSNIVPWLIIAKQKNAKIVRIPLKNNGTVDVSSLKKLINKRTKLISISQMSNVTGFMPDITFIVNLAHQNGVKVAVDGAQGVVHSPLDVSLTGVDFYSFSAHKLYGPNGVGVLYYSPNVAEQFHPTYSGGQMLSTIKGNEVFYKKPPFKYESGTPNIAGVLGFGEVLKWLNTVDFSAMEAYTNKLSKILSQELTDSIEGYIGYSKAGSSIISFNINRTHHVDMLTLISESGVSIRSGKHCAIPLMNHFGVSGTLRASLAPYNNETDIEKLIDAVIKAKKILG